MILKILLCLIASWVWSTINAFAWGLINGKKMPESKTPAYDWALDSKLSPVYWILLFGFGAESEDIYIGFSVRLVVVMFRIGIGWAILAPFTFLVWICIGLDWLHDRLSTYASKRFMKAALD